MGNREKISKEKKKNRANQKISKFKSQLWEELLVCKDIPIIFTMYSGRSSHFLKSEYRISLNDYENRSFELIKGSL